MTITNHALPCLLFRCCFFVFAACRPLCLLSVARVVMSQATKCHVSVWVGNTFECKGFSYLVQVVVGLSRLMLQPRVCLCGCVCALLPLCISHYVHCSLCACVVMALLSRHCSILLLSARFMGELAKFGISELPASITKWFLAEIANGK